MVRLQMRSSASSSLFLHCSRIFNATLRQAKNERFFTSNFKGSQLAAQYIVPGAAQCLKITQNVSSKFLNFGFFYQFCRIEIDLSGNTVWPQSSDFQKHAKLTILAFLMNFCPLKM